MTARRRRRRRPPRIAPWRAPAAVALRRSPTCSPAGPASSTRCADSSTRRHRSSASPSCSTCSTAGSPLTGSSSAFGVEFDSLADLISSDGAGGADLPVGLAPLGRWAGRSASSTWRRQRCGWPLNIQRVPDSGTSSACQPLGGGIPAATIICASARSPIAAGVPGPRHPAGPGAADGAARSASAASRTSI